MKLNWAVIQSAPEDQWQRLLHHFQTELLEDANTELACRLFRADMLKRVHGGLRDAPRLIELLSAFSAFCADCEFVFGETHKEQDLCAQLLPEDAASSLILACYRSSGALTVATGRVEQLLPITDVTSRHVQSMYEENPYPRWKRKPEIAKPSDAVQTILVAGCGTGQHLVMTALQHPRSQVVGIDLSRASLAYGAGKAHAFGIENARFVHGDMHEVAALGLQFDFISAVGSVHHADDPVRAARALAGVLCPTGTLKLAMYSTHGRASVLSAIALRKQHGIPSTAEGIRAFRQMIYQLPADHPARGVTAFQDFYSISGCRDLLFHVKEHNYTVPEIFDFIDSVGLRLVDFLVPGHKHLKGVLERAPLADLEQTHPGFAGPMFRFVLAHPT